MSRSVVACVVCLASAVLCGACASTSSSASSVSSVSSGSAMEWRPLFDGTDLAGWRGYRSATPPAGWHVVDGTLVREGPGGDIITADTFANFELALEWKIAPGGNSGIMYRVTEDAQAPYETGPEMQVLDDERHADGRSRLTAAGSLYALYPAPAGVVKPAGAWNAARIVVNGNHVEHWLNGTKTVDAEIGSDDWNQRVASSKFRRWPGFGKAKRGHIALQDHGDWVAYRNIQIRVLP
jgi:3-keto-disaccharide hydrolase